MPWVDVYLGMVAAAFAFGAVLSRGASMSWAWTATLLGLAAAAGLASVLLNREVRRSVRSVLVVGERRRLRRPAFALRSFLGDAGFAIRSCPGPAARPCPVLQGSPCPVPGHPAAALILRDGAGSGGEPVPPCGDALHVSVLLLDEQSMRRPSIRQTEQGVEWDRGPAMAVRALRELLPAPG